MHIRRLRTAGRAAGLWLLATVAHGTPLALDTNDPQNGILGIYSATFDGAMVPCSAPPASPPYSPASCSFFGGYPPAARNIVIVPTPTRVTSGVPGGFAVPPAAGSSLDVTVNAGHTQVTLAGGTVALPQLSLVIDQGTANETNIVATGAGMVFNAAPVTAPIDTNRIATFEVTLAPSLAVDFSTLGTVVTSCTGPLCALVTILTLDMVRYQLVMTFDPTFGSFTGTFIGQTANNSEVFATLNSTLPTAPGITVTDSVAPAADGQVPFGNTTIGSTATRTVTVTSSGTAPLVLGTLALADPLAPPFSLANDGCSGQTLNPSASCTVDIQFSPTAIGNASDTFGIPSNDTSRPVVTVSTSGTGAPLPVPNIAVTDSVAPGTDLAIPYGSVTQGQQADEVVTVTNAGTADLNLGTVGSVNPLAVPFSVVTDGCSGQVLAAGTSCTITTRFAPTTTGDFADSFDIPSNDPDEPTLTLQLTGKGVAPPVPRIKSDLDLRFGEVAVSATSDLTVTVSNEGSGALVIGTVASADPLAAPYSRSADNCSGQTLAPAASCTIVARFAPTAHVTYNDSFDIPSNDPDQPTVTVGLHGGPPAPGPKPDGASAGPFGATFDGGTVLALLLLGPVLRRRRRAAH